MAAYNNLWGPGNKESKAKSYGRKKPIVAYRPNHDTEQYITTTETITEHVLVPQVSTYRTSSPMEAGGFFNNGSSRPVSAYHDRPPRVDDYVRKTQDVASQAARINLENGSYGYGRPSDAGINKWNKPARDPYFEISGGRNQMVSYDSQDPHLSTLSKPTNDIGTIINYLKDGVNGTPQRPFTVPTIAVPKVQTYGPTIDSTEGQWRYGLGFSGPPQTVRTADTYSSAIDSRESQQRYGPSFSGPPQTVRTVDTYSSAIDSREAARRYHGASIN